MSETNSYKTVTLSHDMQIAVLCALDERIEQMTARIEKAEAARDEGMIDFYRKMLADARDANIAVVGAARHEGMKS